MISFFVSLLNLLISWKSFKVYRFECILSFLLSHDRHQAISEIPSWHFFWWWIMSLLCKTIHVEPYKRRHLFNMVVGYYCSFLCMYSPGTEIVMLDFMKIEIVYSNSVRLFFHSICDLICTIENYNSKRKYLMKYIFLNNFDFSKEYYSENAHLSLCHDCMCA